MDSFIASCAACGAKNRVAGTKQHLGPKCGKCSEKLDIGDLAIPVNLGDKSMDSFIQSVQLPVLADFFSPSCGPCASLAPVINQMAKKYLGRVIIAKVDTSTNPGSAAFHQIKGVPTLIFFKNGKKVEEIVGLPDKAHLQAKLDYYGK